MRSISQAGSALQLALCLTCYPGRNLLWTGVASAAPGWRVGCNPCIGGYSLVSLAALTTGTTILRAGVVSVVTEADTHVVMQRVRHCDRQA